jgi:hypothetical protein
MADMGVLSTPYRFKPWKGRDSSIVPQYSDQVDVYRKWGGHRLPERLRPEIHQKAAGCIGAIFSVISNYEARHSVFLFFFPLATRQGWRDRDLRPRALESVIKNPEGRYKQSW